MSNAVVGVLDDEGVEGLVAAAVEDQVFIGAALEKIKGYLFILNKKK